MTTVIDPLGTPIAIFNRSGIAIIPLDGGLVPGGTTAAGVGNDGTVIPQLAQTTIAIVLTSITGDGWKTIITLSEDAQIGDVVEVYLAPGSTTSGAIFPPVGQAIDNMSVSTGTNTGVSSAVDDSTGRRFRKISATLWMQAA